MQRLSGLAMLIAFAGIARAGLPAAANAGAHARAPVQASICQGEKKDRILIRVIRPAISYRIPPSIEQIDSEGDRYAMIRDSAVWKTIAARLCAAWPPLTPDLHLLSFDEPDSDDRVELLLAFGDAADRLRDVVATVDAFYLDGFAPALNPQMWNEAVFKAL